MKSLIVLVLFLSTVVFAHDSKEYRAEYDQSVKNVSDILHPDIQEILQQENIGKSLVFLPIIKVEVVNSNELEIFTEYCSRKIRLQKHRGDKSEELSYSFISISEGSCSGD